MRHYLTTFCGASALGIGAVAAFNYVVDPYLIHQWETPEVHRLRPPVEKLSAWGKTYAIARYRPVVLHLGNSRTELALQASHPSFGGAPAFNGALSGASLGDMAAMANHAMALGPLHTVVWGLDAPSFTTEQGALDFDRGLIANGEAYLSRRAMLDIRRSLAFDMTSDAVSEVRGSFGRVCRSSLAFHGQRDQQCVADHMRSGGGTAAAVPVRLGDFARGKGPSRAAVTLMDATLGSLCRNGTRLRLYINPTHASMHVAFHAAGRWKEMEDWQRDLTSVVSKHRQQGCDLRLFDFSGFNTVTTESLPQASGNAEMHYYWEPSHYRANVGQMIMHAMFGGDADFAVPDDFGVELTTQTVVAHQQAQRRARDEYVAAHPVEARIARHAVRR